ncbi:MAG: hypothetical protein E7107_08410 [Prevotella sp.]|nr:hypothetical protein [Prevotella sp.]
MKLKYVMILLFWGYMNNLQAQKIEPVTLSEASEAKLTTFVDSLLYGLGYSLLMTNSLPQPQEIGKFTGTYAFLMARPNDDPNEAVKGLSGADPLAVTYFIKSKEVLTPMATSGQPIPYKFFYKGVLHIISKDTSIIKDDKHFSMFWESVMNTVKSNSKK